ncbi:hypothetical protein MAR_021917 [Mya arenaria]|uniref:Uncharacterized protein n=1 Tax=Mya arenaria TaxID=6604 RepID=A0ABY7ECV8_MYAAR|nr:hypothetical protein MAR_021917 [Mya arenaria]
MYFLGDNSRRSFKVLLKPILIGSGAFVALCIFVGSANVNECAFVLYRVPDKTEVTPSAIETSPSLDTNVFVEIPETSIPMNASHDLIREETIMARKQTTAIESQHAESSLIYANLDIDHLQKAFVGPIRGPRPTIRKEATEYQDIDFYHTKPAGPH